MKILYFCNVIDENNKIIKLHITKDLQEAHRFLDNYKAHEGFNCVLEYKIILYSGKTHQQVSHYYQ